MMKPRDTPTTEMGERRSQQGGGSGKDLPEVPRAGLTVHSSPQVVQIQTDPHSLTHHRKRSGNFQGPPRPKTPEGHARTPIGTQTAVSPAGTRRALLGSRQHP